MSNVLREKFNAAIQSLLPVMVIVLVLNFTVAPMSFAVRGIFLVVSIFLVVGMAVFTLGADLAMMLIGEVLGGLAVQDYLGFGDGECDVMSVVPDGKADKAISLIEYGYANKNGADDGRTADALVPILGVSGPLVLEYISGPAV